MESNHVEDLMDEVKRIFDELIQAYEDELSLEDMYKYKEKLTNEYYELMDEIDYVIDEMERSQSEEVQNNYRIYDED